jgi:L-lactate dehydrogenase
LAISEIVRTILKDQHKVLPVSCLIEDYYGVNDVCLSVPVVLYRKGIKEKIKLHLNDVEKKQLRKSARTIKSHINQVI